MAVFAFFKTKEVKIDDKKNYFSILIAARNEEKVISALIESLKKQNYDKKYYDINVIINNCTDNTLKIAENANVNVINCKTKISCKADALRYAFEELKDKKIDAYVIFDADNVVHPDFLKYMNYSINNGYKVAQGTRETKNLGQNWISSSYAIYYYLQNFFFSRSRKNLNLSNTINGTGFMVKKEVIDKYGFDTKTLTEDIEFSGICILNGIKIDYVEKAITYDEQPVDFKVSWHQRMRWTHGTLNCSRLYGFKLFKNFFKTFSLSNIDVLFLYLSPIIQIVSFVVVLITIIIELINFNVGTLESLAQAYVPSMIVSYLAFIVVSIFVVAYNKHKISKTISGILLFMLFIFTWLPINIVCLFKRKMTWKPVEHKVELSINQIIGK